MAAGEIVVAFGDQNLAGQDQLLLEVAMCVRRSLGHVPCPSSFAVRWPRAPHDEAACAVSQDIGLFCGRSAREGGAAKILPAITMQT
jgi:hypothetical protein